MENISNIIENITFMNITDADTLGHYDATPYIVLSIFINFCGLVGNALVAEFGRDSLGFSFSTSFVESAYFLIPCVPVPNSSPVLITTWILKLPGALLRNKSNHLIAILALCDIVCNVAMLPVFLIIFEIFTKNLKCCRQFSAIPSRKWISARVSGCSAYTSLH